MIGEEDENVKRLHPAWDMAIEEPDIPSEHSEEEERDALADDHDSFHST